MGTLHNVHVTLVIHPRKDSEEKLSIHSIFGGGKATQEADNVILLQTVEEEDSVVKKKFCGDLGKIPLWFTKPVLSLSKKVGDKLKKKEGASPAAKRKVKSVAMEQEN